MSENQEYPNDKNFQSQSVNQEQPKEANNNIIDLMNEEENEDGVKYTSDDKKIDDDDSDNLKIDLGYADEEEGQEPPDEVYKQYVRKKLLEVNKEFEKEANDENQGSDNERQKTIKFSNQVVEVAPSPRNYSETDEDNEDSGTTDDLNSESQGEKEICSKKDEPNKSQNKDEETDQQEGKNEQNLFNNDSKSTKKSDQEENILVEKDGTYKLVKKSELEAIEKSNNDQTTPKPPNEPRPKSAKSSRPRSTPGRLQSTQKVDISHYVSPYALSDTQKKEGERQRKEREKQEREREEELKKEEARKEAEQEANFQCWLRKSLQKRRDEQKQEEEQRQREERRKKEADEADKQKKNRSSISFPNWLDSKRQQREKEELSKREKQKEEQDHAKAFAASKKECEKAFKRWRRRKINEEKRKQQELSTKNKTNKLLSRRTRNKALLLSYAVRQQSAFKDDVEWDEAQEIEAQEKIKENSKTKISPDSSAKYENEAHKYWDAFYSIHQNRFFKDRHWLFTEFPEVLPNNLEEYNGQQENSEFVGSHASYRIFEVGCGVGNSVFPIIQSARSKNLFVYCCDLSETAINLVKQHNDYSENSCHAFVHDITDIDKTLPFPEGSLDVIALIFVLSAVNPNRMEDCIIHLSRYLKPGGIILFRDYGRYDMAQLRFKNGKCLSDNFYVRGDGTRVYFFTQDDLRNIFAKAGLIEIQNHIDRRMQVNRGKKIKMYRVWIQCKYKKPNN
ncbi:DgyrCDS6003 [Dimorphilus gyrociliatus]|uniref:DgyrCDS6003 n=1 Tax=Dimorphilus gyrociliatus TaxID=2664684 RepID=A0A7I8VRJ1_9ANNE|nr:DgyrCDS6003 [Dimorphilus gyrociliatus]